MRISVFGLGYVGAVTAACLSRDRNRVIGVDVSEEKVRLVSDGVSPFVEPGLDALLSEAVAARWLRSTTSAQDAVAATDVSLVSVGTPQSENGEQELQYVFGVCQQIAAAVERKASPHVVVLRSTVPPGTLAKCAAIFAEFAPSVKVDLAFNPEFLREGSAIADYDRPPYTIIGTDSPRAETIVRQMYAQVPAPVFVVPPAVAEMTKQVANAWHATKVSFANEIGRISAAVGVDGRDVMNLIVADTKLNISPAYLRPGFAYGGSCLPKDLAALLFMARRKEVAVPLLSALRKTNASQVELAVRAALRTKPRRVALLGLAFKSGTDDLRESPSVPLVKRLLGEGCSVSIYDPAVSRARLVGTNLAYIRANVPHFEQLLVDDVHTALKDAELIIVAHATTEFRLALLDSPEGARILDLAGVFAAAPENLHYEPLN